MKKVKVEVWILYFRVYKNNIEILKKTDYCVCLIKNPALSRGVNMNKQTMRIIGDPATLNMSK